MKAYSSCTSFKWSLLVPAAAQAHPLRRPASAPVPPKGPSTRTYCETRSSKHTPPASCPQALKHADKSVCSRGEQQGSAPGPAPLAAPTCFWRERAARALFLPHTPTAHAAPGKAAGSVRCPCPAIICSTAQYWGPAACWAAAGWCAHTRGGPLDDPAPHWHRPPMDMWPWMAYC